MLGTVCYKLIPRWHLDFEIDFVDRMEFKNDCDSFFGGMDASLHSAQRSCDIITPGDAVSILNDNQARLEQFYTDAGLPPPERSHFFEFFPAEHKDFFDSQIIHIQNASRTQYMLLLET